MNLLWIVCAFLVAGFVQGSIGFGVGLVSIALLGLVLDVREAATVNVLASLGVTLFMLWRLWTHLRWRRVWPVAIAVLLGAPLGVWILRAGQPPLLYAVLAGVLLFAGGETLLRNNRRDAHGSGSPRGWPLLWAGVPCGFLSGALTGAYGTGGPPLVAYVSSQNHPRLRYAATVQMLLAIGGIIRLEEMLRTGWLTPRLLTHSLVGALAALGGAALGLQLLRRMPERLLRWGIALFLLLVGMRYALRAWSG